jgi:hypothetical protein
MASLRADADPVMRGVLRDTDAEIALFRAHADSYRYAFYVLRAV